MWTQFLLTVVSRSFACLLALMASVESPRRCDLGEIGGPFDLKDPFHITRLRRRTDAAIGAALVPVTLSNAPARSENTTWELLKGTDVFRNLHFSPLVASLQNNTDTLQINCRCYSTAQTYTQAEVNAQITNAVDALNVFQYTMQAEVDGSISACCPTRTKGKSSPR